MPEKRVGRCIISWSIHERMLNLVRKIRTMMEKYIARCEKCGQIMSLEKVINNGAVLLKASYKCPHCGKMYTAEFDKFYNDDKPDLYEIGENGYDADGFDAEGYDKEGYDTGGFDRMHIHRETSTPYDSNGYDWEGYDADGLDERGFDRKGFYKKTGKKYNEDGKDWHGYDRNGYDEYGFDKHGNPQPGTEEPKKFSNLIVNLKIGLITGLACFLGHLLLKLLHN